MLVRGQEGEGGGEVWCGLGYLMGCRGGLWFIRVVQRYEKIEFKKYASDYCQNREGYNCKGNESFRIGSERKFACCCRPCAFSSRLQIK